MNLQAPLKIESFEPLLLSSLESSFCRIEGKFDGATRVVVLLRLDGCIEAELLASSLQYLQWRHPKLRATIVHGEDERFRYTFDQTPPPIPFEITDYGEEDLPWREETRRMLQSSFPAAGPLAAVAVLRSKLRNSCDLILMLHHAIADGVSALTLIEDLLTEYARTEAPIDTPSRPPLAPIALERAKTPAGWRPRLWMLRRFIRIQREDRRSRQTPLPLAPDIAPQSQWLHWVFSREDTLLLIRRCRQERTSLGGAMVAAVCCGLMDCLPISTGSFKCQFPVDVRESLQESTRQVTGKDLGCFFTVMNEYFVVPRALAFWDLSRNAHLALQDFLRHGGPSFIYNMLSLVIAAGRFKGALPTVVHSKSVTLMANSYGIVNIRDEYGSLRPRDCTLTFKNCVTGPSLVIQTLVIGQRLNVGLAGNDLEPAFWRRLHAAVYRQLQTSAAVVQTASSF